jgi:hypothetical protein
MEPDVPKITPVGKNAEMSFRSIFFPLKIRDREEVPAIAM